MIKWLILCLLISSAAHAQLSQPFTVGTTSSPGKINNLFQDLYDRTQSKASVTAAIAAEATARTSAIANAQIARANLSESVMCDGGAAGAATGTAAGDVTLITYTWPSDARYLVVTSFGLGNVTYFHSRHVINLSTSTIVGAHSSCSYNNTNRVATAINTTVSVPHTLAIAISAVLFKITTFDTATRSMVLKTNGAASAFVIDAHVESFR